MPRLWLSKYYLPSPEMSVWTELSAKDLNNGKKGIIPKCLCFGDKNVPDCKISFHYLLCQYLHNPLASLFFLVSPPIKLAGALGVVAANTNPTKGTQQLWKKAGASLI